jgi:hypothetical protein
MTIDSQNHPAGQGIVRLATHLANVAGVSTSLVLDPYRALEWMCLQARNYQAVRDGVSYQDVGHAGWVGCAWVLVSSPHGRDMVRALGRDGGSQAPAARWDQTPGHSRIALEGFSQQDRWTLAVHATEWCCQQIADGNVDVGHLDVVLYTLGGDVTLFQQSKFVMWELPGWHELLMDRSIPHADKVREVWDGPQGAIFREWKRQSGWDAIFNEWYRYSWDTYRRDMRRHEEQDRRWGWLKEAAKWCNGDKAREAIQDKADAYFAQRAAVIKTIRDAEEMERMHPGILTEAEKADLQRKKEEFDSVDYKVYLLLKPFGFWPYESHGLGVAPLVVAGLALAKIGIICATVYWGLKVIKAIIDDVLGYDLGRRAVNLAAQQQKDEAERTRKQLDMIASSDMTPQEKQAASERVVAKSREEAQRMRAFADKVQLNFKELAESTSAGSDATGMMTMLAIIGVGGFVAYKALGRK